MPRHESGATRRRAVDAARRLFYERGFLAVSMDEVAREAGVSKVTVYSHFQSKDALAAAALAEEGVEVVAALREMMDAAGSDPRDRVLAVFDCIAAEAGADGYRGCAFLNASAQAARANHPVHDRLRAHKGEVRALFRDEAAAAGHPDPDKAADELALLQNGALAVSGALRDPGPVAVARRLAARVLSGDGALY